MRMARGSGQRASRREMRRESEVDKDGASL